MIKSIWGRLCDRSKTPLRWWFPGIEQYHEPLSQEEWKVQHNETSQTIRKVMITLIVFSLFSLVTLGTQDAFLFLGGEAVKIPVSDTPVSFLAFIFLGPLVMVGLLIYLHIFIYHHFFRLGLLDRKEILPFIFNLNNFFDLIL